MMKKVDTQIRIFICSFLLVLLIANLTFAETTFIKEYPYQAKERSASDWFEKGYALNKSGAYKEAIDAYSKAIALNPEDVNTSPYCHYNRGMVFVKIAAYGFTINDFNKAIELLPNYDEAYNSRGFSYYSLANNNIEPTTNYGQALKDYNMAIKLNPRSVSAYVNRGSVNAVLGFNDKALNDFNAAIKIDPSGALPYGKRGLLYLGKGFTEKSSYFHELAVKDFSSAIELDPTEQVLYGLLAGAYGALGKNELENKDLQTAARLGSKDAQNQLIEKNIRW